MYIESNIKTWSNYFLQKFFKLRWQRLLSSEFYLIIDNLQSDTYKAHSPFKILCTDFIPGVAIFQGVSAGKAVVSVTVKISSKSRNSHFQLLQDRELTATLELLVVDRLEAKLPVSCLNHVLVSPEASLLLATNKNEKTVYSIVGESSGFSVSRRGLITAPRNTGTTVVLGSVTEDGGLRQQVFILNHL